MEFFLIIRKYICFFFLLMLFFNLGKQTSIKTGVYHIGIIIIDPSGVARWRGVSGLLLLQAAARWRMEPLRAPSRGSEAQRREEAAEADPPQTHSQSTFHRRHRRAVSLQHFSRARVTKQAEQQQQQDSRLCPGLTLTFISLRRFLFSRTFLSTHIYLRI